MIAINLNAVKTTLKLALLATLTYLLLNLASQSRIYVPTTYKVVTEDSVLEQKRISKMVDSIVKV
jgi:hypothetical protein